MQNVRPPKGKVPTGVKFIAGSYYVKWMDGHGKWRRKVCTATSMEAAKTYRAELQQEGYRQRMGLDPLPGSSTYTLAQATTWWLGAVCPKRSRKVDGLQLGKHVVNNQALGPVRAGQVTPSLLDGYFDKMLENGFSPATINKIRSKLFSVYEAMKAAKPPLFVGANPVADTSPRTVLKRKHVVLEPDQIDRLLRWVPKSWRGYFACAIYTALRKGELSGLEKTRVDLKYRLLEVARSYDHDTTKGNRVDGLPIADALVPYLAHALASSPVTSPYVFPRPDGSMRTEDDNPEKILRTALGRAGIVTGYRFNCRPCNKGWKAEGRKRVFEFYPDSADRHCRDCGAKLLCTPVPVGMKFHDLRHSAITMLIRAGVPMTKIQKIARHANITTTLGTYGHLDVEDLRGAVNSIAPAPAATGERSKEDLIAAAMAMLAEAQALPASPANPETRGQPVVNGLRRVK